jgi:hypothetical protein
MATDLSESASLSTPHGVIEDISPLEQDLLDEYERLADNMKKVGFLASADLLHTVHYTATASFLRVIFASGN